MINDIERRLLDGHMVTSGRRLVGHAARFGVPTRIDGEFTETIYRGAFKRSLKANPDILGVIDHDMTRLLGRTRSGTLRLREDDLGLAFEIDVPDTQTGRDVLALAERGDLGGMSFGFRVPPGGEEWNSSRSERMLRTIDLVEVSVISSFPAYPNTSVSARSRHGSERSDLSRRIALLDLGGRT